MSTIYTFPNLQDSCEVKEFTDFEQAREWAKGIHKPKIKDGFYVPRSGGIIDYTIYKEREKKYSEMFLSKVMIKQESNMVILHKDTKDPSTVVFLVRKRIRPIPGGTPSIPASIENYRKYTLEQAREIGGEIWDQWKEEKIKRIASLKMIESLGPEFIEAHKKYILKKKTINCLNH